ncbi:MAG TPA: biotin--[acetyl-CoA-carboxylase] ligase [Methylomirabilota bacterium]|nr:biotin--[acetyl-CoA-carboxylase] ligase [Methylomirabilota bacterium]
MIKTPFLARQEHFAVVGSTNDIVRGWLAEGEPEVCLAVADEQSAGRGREGRTWSAPAGQALLMSLGFRPTWLAPDRVWRLAAVSSLAMADAAEAVAGLADGSIRLKWPNDLVVESSDEWLEEASPSPSTSEGSGPARHLEMRKLAGVLGETDGLGGDDPRAVIGIGINADWPASEFPPELADTMTSLHEASRGRSIDPTHLLEAFLGRLESRIEALRAGRFDAADWHERQLTTGRTIRLVGHDGDEEIVRALRTDPDSGALIVADARAASGERAVISGEIRHVRLDGAV